MLLTFPKFHQVEPQLLRGKIGGLVVAQRAVKYEGDAYAVPTVAYGDKHYIENGILCGFDAAGKVVNADARAYGPIFLHFTEEMQTNPYFYAKNQFAVEGKKEDTYLRLIQLVPGDEYVTDNVDGELVAGTVYGIKDGVISAAATADKYFLYEVVDGFDSTLPNGEVGYHFIYLGETVA